MRKIDGRGSPNDDTGTSSGEDILRYMLTGPGPRGQECVKEMEMDKEEFIEHNFAVEGILEEYQASLLFGLGNKMTEEDKFEVQVPLGTRPRPNPKLFTPNPTPYSLHLIYK